MQYPSISLLIPCYNAAKSLHLLLNDVLQQTIAFSEIIVYDDASTDNSAEIANQYGCQVIEGEINRGAGFVRQQLLEAATSDYIHFHDADDRIEANFLEFLLPYCTESIAVCCALKEVQKDGKILVRTYEPLNKEVDKISFFIRNFVHMNTMIYPRKASIEAGGFDVELRTNQDRVFHYRLATSNLSFRFIDQPLATQIRNVHSTLSNTKFSHIVANFVRGAEIAMDIFPQAYYPLLAEYLLFYAEKAAYRGEYSLVKHSITVAKRCGAKSLTAQGRFSNVLSQVIGIENTLIVRHQYTKLRQLS